MKRINSQTKKAQNLINAYNNATKTDIRDCYSYHCSDAKIAAQYRIKKEMDALNGFDYYICSASGFNFYCAYTYPDPETGELVLRYETRDNTYEVLL